MSITSASAAAPSSFTPRVLNAIRHYGTFGIFLVLVIVASFWSDAFLTERNLMNVVRQVASGAGIMAIGMLFVVLTRGIDLSVGSIAAVGSVLCAHLVAAQGYGVPMAILLVILTGAACGVVTGFFVAYMRLPSFVISLAMMAIARGISLIISAGRPITMGSPGASLVDFGSGFLFGIPQPAILMLVIYAIGGVVLLYTSFGRIVTAIGSNEEAVRLSGVPVERYVLSVYVISGALAAVAGIVAAGRTGIGTPQCRCGARCHRGGRDWRGQPHGRARRHVQHAARRADPRHHHQHHEPRRRAGLSPERLSRTDHHPGNAHTVRHRPVAPLGPPRGEGTCPAQRW
ncbi:Ribose/xylose/arabinose/galactoside ABC-type transport systems, permease component [Sinorhizobium meliloti GR4]|nr:Ribose/xylose/arabinose/galactoside ABC-type transport systems, permease component [Sinorhizobium meliloti GR4]